jgi:two-component system alkaline phosphatase synthesis response regulator PhoP
VPAVSDEDERKTILVVDDETSILDLLSDLLEPLGYRVLRAETGKAGLALAQEQLPDVVILDIMMEDMDGTEVRSRLKDHPLTAAIPVIYVTGLMAEGEATRRTGDEGDLMIAKPFDADELVGHVRRLT